MRLPTSILVKGMRYQQGLIEIGWLAGAPGFEPGNGGTKNRCLTTWRRPNRCGVYIIAKNAAGNSVLHASRYLEAGLILPLRRFALAAISPASREFLGVGV